MGGLRQMTDIDTFICFGVAISDAMIDNLRLQMERSNAPKKIDMIVQINGKEREFTFAEFSQLIFPEGNQ
jgi:hypothetical protein